MPVLHHQPVVAEGARPARWILFSHGIFGAGRNWATVARRFVRARPEWGAILVDLRQHGRSMGFAPPHTVDACANDIHSLIRETGLAVRAVLGHSFGGKVSLVYSRRPAVALDRIWVVDSTPDAREPSGSAWRMLGVLRRHPGPFADRNAAVLAVESEGFANSVAQWMSTNLRHDERGYGWRLDPDDMESLMRSFFSTDAWDAVEAPEPGTHVHVVRAEESSVLAETACVRVERAGERTGQAHLHRVAGGHWVNADNPDALHRLLVEHMP